MSIFIKKCNDNSLCNELKSYLCFTLGFTTFMGCNDDAKMRAVLLSMCSMATEEIRNRGQKDNTQVSYQTTAFNMSALLFSCVDLNFIDSLANGYV